MQKADQKVVRVARSTPQSSTAMFTSNEMDMPFLTRLMIRERGSGEPGVREEVEEPKGDKGTMQALSVKRLRKLRMKKHKLKKLRKRTRNLRRRVESHSR